MPSVEGPLRSITFAHDAIRTELDELLDMTAGVDGDDADTVAELRDRFEFFTTYMDVHDDIEDAGIYPALEDEMEGASELYEWDHERAEAYFEEFSGYLTALEHGEEVPRSDLVGTMAAIRALLYAHSRKEDELLLPLLTERLSVEEQAALAGKAGEVTPDEVMEDAIKFMMARIDQDGREEMLGSFQQAMPPEAFQAITAWTESVVSEEEWKELEQTIPTSG